MSYSTSALNDREILQLCGFSRDGVSVSDALILRPADVLPLVSGVNAASVRKVMMGAVLLQRTVPDLNYPAMFVASSHAVDSPGTQRRAHALAAAVAVYDAAMKSKDARPLIRALALDDRLERIGRPG